MAQQDPSTAQIPAQRQPSEPAHAATLAHCGLLRSKIDYLTGRLAESMVQMHTSADREYRAGRLTLDDLAVLYDQTRDLAGPGFSRVWSENMSVTAAELRAHLQRKPTVSENGMYWSGPYPYDQCRRPKDGVSVVYVLYDRNLEPIYLGSTAHFGARMGRHNRDGKPFCWWMAYPCESREAAYLLEGGLLAARKPPMNVKAGR